MLGIKSDYVFCNFDGDWVKKDAYITFLRRMLKSMGFKVTNNHAFRKSLNSNILIPRGIPAPERAALLGHSIDTNNRHYSKPRKGYTENLRDILSQDSDVVTMSHQQIIPFPQKILCARDGDLTLRKQSGGLFLVKSGAIYDCDLTDVVREMGLEPTRRCHH